MRQYVVFTVAALCMAGAFGVASVSTASPQSTAQPAPFSALPEGEGRDVTEQVCGQCHNVRMFSNQRHDRDGWNATITRMLDKGMSTDEDTLYEISDYLTEYLGKDDQNASTPS